MDPIEEQLRRIKDKVDCLNYQLTPELQPENFDIQRFLKDMKVNKAIADQLNRSLAENFDEFKLCFNEADHYNQKEEADAIIRTAHEANVLTQIINSIEAGKYFKGCN